MKITTVLLEMNKENLNGRIYTRECVENMIEQFNRKFGQQGYFFGETGIPDSTTVSLSKISHNVTKIEIQGNKLLGDIQILNTPQGEFLKSFIKESLKDYISLLIEITNPKVPIVFRPRSIGSVNPDKTIEITELISFDVVPRDNDAFKGLLDGESQYIKLFNRL